MGIKECIQCYTEFEARSKSTRRRHQLCLDCRRKPKKSAIEKLLATKDRIPGLKHLLNSRHKQAVAEAERLQAAAQGIQNDPRKQENV